MKFYVMEKEALDELWRAETLGEIVRIGFNRVDIEDTDGNEIELLTRNIGANDIKVIVD